MSSAGAWSNRTGILHYARLTAGRANVPMLIPPGSGADGWRFPEVVKKHVARRVGAVGRMIGAVLRGPGLDWPGLRQFPRMTAAEPYRVVGAHGPRRV